MSNVIHTLEAYVRKTMSDESTGHDWHHVRQVRDMALRIAETEGGDKEIIELAALAHDIGDRKFHDSEEEGDAKTIAALKDAGASDDTIERVMYIIRNISFKGGGVGETMETLEGKIVQDADRLYALGAIGIARTFAYGGAKGRLIYDPAIPPQLHYSKDAYYASKSPTINHFYEKLLLLKDRMNTATGRICRASCTSSWLNGMRETSHAIFRCAHAREFRRLRRRS
jgi:uncharacterized protein